MNTTQIAINFTDSYYSNYVAIPSSNQWSNKGVTKMIDLNKGDCEYVIAPCTVIALGVDNIQPASLSSPEHWCVMYPGILDEKFNTHYVAVRHNQ